MALICLRNFCFPNLGSGHLLPGGGLGNWGGGVEVWVARGGGVKFFLERGPKFPNPPPGNKRPLP